MDRRAFLAGAASLGVLGSRSEAAGTCYPDGTCEIGIQGIVVRTPFQECEQWCWAASIQAIFGLHGFDVDQRTIVQRLFGQLICRPASNADMFNAVNGRWLDRQGRQFSAQSVLLWDPSIGMANPAVYQFVYSDLYAGRPLLCGAAGHATVVTAIRYWPTQPVPRAIYVTVRDPWPYSPNQRNLNPNEMANTAYLARVLVG